jgi:hypothetical protein
VAGTLFGPWYTGTERLSVARDSALARRTSSRVAYLRGRLRASRLKKMTTRDKKPYRPDWAVCNQLDEIELWEAVALLLDMDPIPLRSYRKQIGSGEGLDLALTLDGIPISPRFPQLLRLAESHLGRTLSAVKMLDGDRKYTSIIRFPTFKAWAIKMGWELPDKCEKPAPGEPRQISEWPWGQYDTRLLRALAAAVEHFWSSYDPAYPATAPPSAEVEAWLKDRQGVSTREAKIIAQIIRADNLPPGPRVNP